MADTQPFQAKFDGRFVKGEKPWNSGVKGYTNHKNSFLRKDKTNPLFCNSLTPRHASCGVYSIIHNESGKIYIGSSNKIGRRMARHRSNVSNRKDVHNRLVSAMIAEPLNFEFSIIEETKTRDEAYEREQFWINFYQSYNPELGYNNCRYSTSPKGAKHSPEANAEKTIRQTGAKKNYKPSEDHIRKMILARSSMSAEKISEYNKRAAETRKKLKVKWKKVLQLTESGEFVREFESLTIAGKSTGIIRANISNVCNNKRQMAGGFKWRLA